MHAGYRMLALDMDGTLLNSERQITRRTAYTLGNLAKSGVEVSLSTGRGMNGLIGYLPDLPFVQFASLLSGCLIMDLRTKKPISAHSIPTQVVCGLLDLARERDAIALLLTTGGSVARQQDIDRMPEVNMSAFQDIYQANSIRTADYYDFVERHPNDVLKVNIFHRSAEDRDGTLNWLRLNPIGSIGLTLARSSISSLECSSGNANKTTGLSEICSRIGISMAEVVYVGDAENDLEAMSASGCAVAMGNALPDVKGKADLVVRDNDHDGIVDAIEALF